MKGEKKLIIFFGKILLVFALIIITFFILITLVTVKNKNIEQKDSVEEKNKITTQNALEFWKLIQLIEEVDN